MNEPLADELRSYFAARLGTPSPGAEARVLGVLGVLPEQPRRYAVLRWTVASVGVVAIFAAIGSITISHRLHSAVPSRPSTVASPTPAATPATSAPPGPLLAALAVPAATAVILFHDPADLGQVDGITFDGSKQGRVGRVGAPSTGFVANPDGSLYSTYSDIRDRSGQVVGGLAGTKSRLTWADDNEHFCQMTGPTPVGAAGAPTTLQVSSPGQPARSVAQVGTVHEQTFVRVEACSLASDRAVVVQSGGQGIGSAQLWAVQISTGRVLWTHQYPLGGTSAVDVVASTDASLVAETNWTPPEGATPSVTTSTVFGPAGSTLGHFPGRVRSFSARGSLAVLDDFGQGATRVVRWRDGTVVWAGPAGYSLLSAVAEPGTDRLALNLRNPDYPQTDGFPQGDLYLVTADGQATVLLRKVAI